MMKHEFVAISGYEVSSEDYNNIIEPMYMATNLDKVEFVKALDRSRFEVKHQKSEEATRLEQDIKSRIEAFKEDLKFYQERLQMYQGFVKEEPSSTLWKDSVKNCKEEIKYIKKSIAELKWVLG